jgi:threonylcarbamoyladenosine tRNA methylthiotransferase MtaB
MKRVAFYTLGCKVNQYETQAISGLFEKEGYSIVNFDENADVYVINTCTVTGLSARKSRQIIRRAKKRNEDSIIVAVGCYAQTAPEEIENIPGVDLIIGTSERHKIVDYVKQIESGKRKLKIVDNIMKVKDFEELKIDTHKEHARAFLKIQEGCSQFCAYCIIPYARGPIRSRDPKNVIDEVRKLADNGFKEVVLTGIHLASYGRDMRETSLLDIIKRVHEVHGIERIRLGSIEPTTITEEFVKEVAGLSKLCPHYHISLQSGCDETLKRMNRRYTTGEYRKAVELLRDRIDDVALTTDVMVGFPGETEEEFHKTYMFLDNISFSRMHIFKYSPRRGTPAASFSHQVSPQIKEKRSNMLIDLSKQKALEFNKKHEERVMTVLFEQEAKSHEGFIEGLTANYIRTVCEGDTKLKGEILNVRLNMAKEDFMTGNIISL